MDRLIWVQQEDDEGCGVACVAMLTGNPYKVVKDVVFPDGEVKGMTTGDVRVALALFGRRSAPRLRRLGNGRSYKDLSFNAILRVGKTKANPGGHWVVWNGDGPKRERRFLDPMPPDEQFSRLHNVSYLEVFPDENAELGLPVV